MAEIDYIKEGRPGAEDPKKSLPVPEPVKSGTSGNILGTPDIGIDAIKGIGAHAQPGVESVKHDNPLSDWSQVPFVGDAIGTVRSLTNGVASDVNKLLTDKRYQVYLGIQLLGNLMTDKVYGTGLSPQQAINYLRMAKNMLSMDNLVSTGLDAIRGAINGKNWRMVFGSPFPKNTEIDYSQLKMYDITRINPEVPDNVPDKIYPEAENPEVQQPMGSSFADKDTSLQEFYDEYKKIVLDNIGPDGTYSIENKNLTYWSDEFGNHPAPFKGRKSITGFSLDSNHLWDIALYPYVGSENNDKTYLPAPPYYNESNAGETWIPAISYDMGNFNLQSKEINMSETYEGGLVIPSKRIKNLGFSMTILDDQFGTYHRYFRRVSQIYASFEGAKVCPYKNLTFELDLYVLDVSNHIRYLRKLLVVLSNYDNKLEGSDDPSTVTHSLEFKIVGEIDDKEDL